MEHWSILNLEVYCALNWDYGMKCGKWVYVMDDEHGFDNMKKRPNPHYDNRAKPNKWPKKCKQKIGIDCISCKYVGYCKYEEEEVGDGGIEWYT